MQIDESGEKLVDLRVECPKIDYVIADYLNQDGKHQGEVEDAYFVRESIARMINTAQAALPDGFRLLVRCGYRTPEVQARQYIHDYAELKQKNPSWSKEKLDYEIEKRTDPPDVGPHCTGGAVDLSILNDQGVQPNMGTDMGVFNFDTYTYSDTISDDVKANRKILIDAMQSAGFFNFPGEWWHWSYGDREWAFANNKTAFYGAIERRQPTLSKSGHFNDIVVQASKRILVESN